MEKNEVKNTGRRLGTVSLSGDILEKGNIGLWAFELDPGDEPRMYVNDAMLGLIGLDHQVSPEETYHAWYDHIDEGSYGLVSDAVEKMGSGEYAEVQYPWHHPDGSTMIVRCGGTRNPEYKKGIRIEGTHQNVTKILHYDEAEAGRLREAEAHLRHEQLRREVANYMIDHENEDPIELLKTFAERIRVLIGCDQVIYRDLEETRIMVNSPAIEKTWSVPIEFCQQCQHFDAHHPMYRNGYTEMDNCQEGWEGIPVYHECPIKSSLTRIVYCDGEVAGYLAIHFVTGYHHWTDIERSTLEEFTRILSMSLSRYEARKRSEKYDEVKRTMNMVYSLSDEYDPIAVIDPETGKYSWTLLGNGMIEKYSALSSEGEDFFGDSSKDFEKYVHEEDRKKVKAFYSRENMLEIARTGRTQEIESRWLDRDNSRYLWKHHKLTGMTDSDGRAKAVLGVIDITDRKEEEAKVALQSETIAQQEAFTRFFLEPYASAYYVDLEDLSCRIYKRTDYVAKEYSVIDNYYESFRKYIDAAVVPEDRQELLEMIKPDAVRAALAENPGFTHVYRDMVDGNEKTFRMQVIRGADERHAAFGFMDISEEILEEQYRAEKEDAAEKLIKTFTERYNAAFAANLSTDAVTSLRYDANLLGYGKNFVRFSEVVEYFLGNVVFPQDREQMSKALSADAVRKKLDEAGSFSLECRSFMKDATAWTVVTVSSLDEDNVAVGFSVNNSEIILRHLEEKQSEDYYALFSVDLDTELITAIKDSPVYATGKPGESAPFAANMMAFAEHYEGETREFYTNLSDIEKVKEMFATEDKSTYSYLSAFVGGEKWTTVTIYVIKRHDDGTPAVLTIGFSLMDTMGSDRQELMTKVEEQNIFMGYFLKSYSSAYYVGLEDLTVQIYKTTDYLMEKYPRGLNYLEMMGKYVESDVMPGSRQALRTLLEPKEIKKLLSKKGEFSFIYKVMKEEGERTYRIQVVRGSDVNHVAMGFRDITVEIEAQKRQQETIKKALADSMSANRRNDIMHDMIHSGKWSFSVDADDNVTGAFYSDEVKRIVDNDFSEGVMSWTDIVHPDDIDDALAAFTAAIKDHSCRTPYDVTYRMADRHGVYRWYHSAGRMVREKDGTGEFFGMHVDITDQIEQQEKQQRTLEAALENEKQQQETLRQNMETIGGLTSEYLALYYYNYSEGIYRVYSIDRQVLPDTVKLIEKEKSLFGLINRFAHSNAVHPDDIEKFDFVTPEGIREKLRHSKKLSVRFRRDYGSGWLWSVMDVVKYEPADEEANAIVIGFAERDRDIRAEMEAEASREAARITDGIIKDYNTAFIVNTENDSFRLLKDATDIAERYDAGGFRNSLLAYAEGEVYPYDRESFLASVSHDNIMKELSSSSSSSSYRTEYRAMVGGVPRWHELVVTPVGDRGEMLVAIKERDTGILLQHIEDVMTSHFEGVYVANFNNDQMKILKGTGGFSKYEGKVVPWRDTMKAFSSNLIGDDKAFFRDVYGDPEAIKKLLMKDRDIEYYYRSPNYGGEPVWMKSEVHALTYDRDGMPETAMVGISQIDSQQREKMRMNALIAEQKEQLEEQHKQLEEALSMAQSANRAKTTFLNSMSHDIRTPMNAIIGYTGLAASHIDNKEQVRDYLTKIGQSSDHLLSLINDVLDMSRIESGKMNIEEREENLSDIIHTLRDIVQSDVKSKDLDFFVDAVGVHDESVFVDKLRLNQVLLNVLSNSIKYTPAGGMVLMKVEEKTVKDSGYATFEFTVKDNGMGMTKEFLKTIYDPFTRVKSSTVSGIQGTGLGMAITKNIVDMMGGTIEIESEPGKGTEVRMTFDLRLQSAPRAPEKIAELEGVRGLVVDDDTGSCMSVANMLHEIGMRDEWCTSGREAVMRAKEAYRRGDRFKVYIIDWLMPDMNGLETTRRIRKAIGDDTPIIILTSYDWTEIEEEAKEAGVTAFVSKPMFPSDLHRVLNFCLGKEPGDEPEAEKEYDFEGKRILLVEDNMLNREIATEILGEAGFVLDTAEDGDIAVEKMRNAQPGQYDIVLMDIQMPRMNGYEATKAIRALGTEISKIPIIAMTANAFEEDKKLAIESGMDAHIAKPINVEKMKDTIAKFL